MEQALKILILEDNKADAQLMEHLLLEDNHLSQIQLVRGKKAFEAAWDDADFDAVISDYSLPGFTATDALTMVRARHKHVPFILVTGTVSEEYAAHVIKLGADDYILKDRMARLPAALRNAWHVRQIEKENAEKTEQLSQSEENYRAILERVSDGFVALDKNWCYTYVNQKACEILKREASDLIGKNIWSVFPDAINFPFYKVYHTAMETQQSIHFEEYYKPFDTYLENHIYSSPAGLSIFFRDITRRKKAQEDLRHSEIRLKEAQAIAHISNWEIDLRKNKHTWSDEFFKIFGLDQTTTEPCPELFLALMHPADRDIVQTNMSHALRSYTDSSFSFRFIRKDGTIRYGYTEWKVEFDVEQNPLRLFGILQDITDQTVAAKKVESSNELLEYAAMASSDVIWELDLNSNQYCVHGKKEKAFQSLTAIEWSKGLTGDFIFKDDKKMVKASLKAAQRDSTCKLWECEYRAVSDDNTIFNVINNAIILRDNKGKAVRMIGAISDITKRKMLEAELLNQQHKAQLKIMATALEAQEKERNVIGIELHDNVNQILVGTKLMMSMLKSNNKKQNDLVGECLQNLQNAIDENRKIAHVFVSPDLETVSLVDQLKNLLKNMLNSAETEARLITGNFKEQLLDTERKINIYRIAQEQCTNIVKYANASMVKIKLSTQRDTFKMIIADNGNGMEMGKKTTGIGLRNIQGRLSIFNGNARIISAPGEGFTLEVTIPLS